MKILMLCHDRQIDRRILAQANSLAILGHQVYIIALSMTDKTYKEFFSEKLTLHRVGYKDLLLKNLSIKLNINFSFISYKKLFKLYRGLCILLGYLLFWAKKKFHRLYFKGNIPFTAPFVFFGQQFAYDLVQSHDFPSLEAGYILSNLKKVPLVYDSHELYTEQYVFGKTKKNIYTIFEQKLISNCHLVITVNQSIAEKIANNYKIQQPTTLINALDPLIAINSSQNYNLIRERFNIPHDNKILLFQGMFSKHRQLEYLIEAMSLIKTKNIVLVMMGNGDIQKNLYYIAKDLDLVNKKIYFLDAVRQEDLLMYSASADMGIIPYPHIDLNSYFCTPNKLFEFIQAHLPIIANDSPELKRYVQDEGFGMVYLMNSANDIAEAIKLGFQALETADWKKNLEQKSHQFSWQEVSKVYLKAMEPFLSEVIEVVREKDMCIESQVFII